MKENRSGDIQKINNLLLTSTPHLFQLFLIDKPLHSC
jgi:hypothetical protein